MKGITWATLFFIVMFIGDFISTLISYDLVVYLETNPLYHYFGLAGLGVLNLGVAAVFHYAYIYSKTVNTRHALIFALVLISILRFFIIYSNIQVYLHPPPLEVARAITQEAKTQIYFINVVKPMFLAFAPAWVAFALFKKDHKIMIE